LEISFSEARATLIEHGLPGKVEPDQRHAKSEREPVRETLELDRERIDQKLQYTFRVDYRLKVLRVKK